MGSGAAISANTGDGSLRPNTSALKDGIVAKITIIAAMTNTARSNAISSRLLDFFTVLAFILTCPQSFLRKHYGVVELFTGDVGYIDIYQLVVWLIIMVEACASIL